MIARRAEGAFLRTLRLETAVDGAAQEGHPWDLPVVAALRGGIDLHPRVTYLVGENGSGKSTLLEGVAVACGMPPEGGSSNFRFDEDDSTYAFGRRAAHTSLGHAIKLVRGGRQPRTDFYLRAESLFVASTYLEELPETGGDPLAAYGGRSLHEQSHGQTFLAIMLNRFGPQGLYLLDEPEAALSTQNCLTFLRRMHELVREGSQFVVATHSPLVLAYPDALILACEEGGVRELAWEESEPVRLTRGFLEDRRRFLRALLDD